MVLAIDLNALIISIIVNIIILSPVLWLSGRAFVGKEKAKFTDAVATIAVGTVVGSVFGALFMGFLSSIAQLIIWPGFVRFGIVFSLPSIVQLVIWLALIKHFFDCGWLKALAISLFSVVLFIVIIVALGLLGLSIISLIW